ncbi:hypothetical protein [Pyrobaculum neutrophilum]|uniref:Nitrate reductase gamma subunit n=1 Tax=Pyrobaculum neutrophilum (strain DSM 2338 / JCM 9278 / NBRC 100436 / V24Sta) TaxID=444157 RepID=B1YBW9_PYRNV|nr:hypothetical protein [Pyrobaculum neutrophilum]ACB39353.1 conserved hypothetical protein [Pyrobaculum neutrophilum V24Sta]
MKELLELALWVFFPVALVIFAFGAAYRILRYVFLYQKGVYVHRSTGAGAKIKGLVMTFLNPIIFNIRTKPIDFFAGLLALHFVGLILLIFLLAQHVAYLSAFIPFYSLLWPFALPISSITGALTVTSPIGGEIRVSPIWGPLTVVLNGDVLTIFSLIGIGYKIVEKLWEKAHGAKNVRVGDLLIWPLLFVIVVTGWLAAHHYPPGIENYRLVLGLHIAASALFVAVWPFTKFFHFVWGYWYGKLHEWYDVVIKRGAH